MERSVLSHLQIAYTVAHVETVVYMWSIYCCIHITHTAYIWNLGFMEIWQEMEPCKRTSMIPHVQLRMQFVNLTKWITQCSNWCELGGCIMNFMTQAKPNLVKHQGSVDLWSLVVLPCHHYIYYLCASKFIAYVFLNFMQRKKKC